MVKKNEMVELNKRITLFGVKERTLAAESLQFLVEVLQQCGIRMEELLPQKHRPRVALLLSFTEQVSSEFRRYMFRNLAPYLINFKPVQQSLLKCKWEQHELQTHTNAYVDLILNDVQASSSIITDLGGLPSHVLRRLWGETVEYIVEKLTDGYSKIIRCTTHGRAQMSMDLTALHQGLVKVTSLSPLPRWEHVSGYVRAYYEPENDFLKWVNREHRAF